MINRIKNDFIGKNDKKLLNDEENDYSFMNNNKYYYIALTLLAFALLAKFLSKQDGIDFVLIALVIFKLTKNLDNIRSHVEITIMLNWKNLKSLKQCEIRKLMKRKK